jgi:hypothetical protein
MPPQVRVREATVHSRHVRTRLPFRYGTAVVTGQPYAHVRAAVEVDGRRVTGVSAAALPPAWFDKAPGRTHEDDVRDLLRSLRAAIDAYGAAGARDAYGLHRAAEAESRRRLGEQNDLTAGFGVALLDAAVADAVCRATGRTFHAALAEDLLGFGPLDLPDRPLGRILVRHTVGMGDPLTRADLASPVGDGLPETLEEEIRAYGLRWFKVKISGDAGASLERLLRIAAVLDRGVADYGVTVDGNEQFHSMEEFGEFLARATADAALARFWRNTAWIEQPVERGRALLDSVAGPLRQVSGLKPVLIDESDGTDDAVERALGLGYVGISAKNCKGVYRTLHSHRVVRRASALLSSEDLMNIPVVPLHQDLAVAAALGIEHSERNGHHYIRAFRFFSDRERAAALREFPSLYREGPEGIPALRIEGGALDLREINAFAFGVRSEPDWEFLRHEAG